MEEPRYLSVFPISRKCSTFLPLRKPVIYAAWKRKCRWKKWRRRRKRRVTFSPSSPAGDVAHVVAFPNDAALISLQTTLRAGVGVWLGAAPQKRAGRGCGCSAKYDGK